MTKTDKLAGTCSVCLRPMQLRNDRPIRHGFSAVGVHHGQHGGFHTGPCGGTGFPHLGISTEGTQWALDLARTRLDRVRADLAHLATNPDLVWHPTNYNVRGKPLDLSRPITLKYGEELPYEVRNTGAPSYDHEHRKRKAQLDNQEHELERTIAEYERVLATYSPQKYPTTGSPAKVETTHMERPVKTVRGEMMGTLCRSGRRGRAIVATTCEPRSDVCRRREPPARVRGIRNRRQAAGRRERNGVTRNPRSGHSVIVERGRRPLI